MRISISIRKNLLNIFLVFVVAGLYLLNNVYFKYVTKGILCQFMNGYFNDLICPLFFSAYSNILLGSVHKKLSKLWQLAIISLCTGLIWEYFAPSVNAGAVSDPWDIVCYELGTVLYWSLLKCINEIKERRKINDAAT